MPHLAASSFKLLIDILVLIHHVIILFEHLLYLLLVLCVFEAIVAFDGVGLLHHRYADLRDKVLVHYCNRAGKRSILTNCPCISIWKFISLPLQTQHSFDLNSLGIDDLPLPFPAIIQACVQFSQNLEANVKIVIPTCTFNYELISNQVVSQVITSLYRFLFLNTWRFFLC